MKVAIITPTIGTEHLKKNLQSVSSQSYKNVKHIVVSDGPEFYDKVNDIVKDFDDKIVLNLPENTGSNGYNGHRIYASVPYLIDADYFIFLDEDNWIDQNHVQSLVDVVKKFDWAFSLRKIIDQDDNYICNDDCESLGLWPTCINENEFFVDVGCYFLPKKIAIQTAPIWYRRARHPNEQPEVDRLLIQVLLQNKLKYGTTGEYSLNYRVGNRVDSVQSEFFIRGNEFMKKKYEGRLPWTIKSDNSVVEEIGPGITLIS
jgi:glycosyltransferase involved in cell wall biosynthesis